MFIPIFCENLFFSADISSRFIESIYNTMAGIRPCTSALKTRPSEHNNYNIIYFIKSAQAIYSLIYTRAPVSYNQMAINVEHYLCSDRVNFYNCAVYLLKINSQLIRTMFTARWFLTNEHFFFYKLCQTKTSWRHFCVNQ